MFTEVLIQHIIHICPIPHAQLYLRLSIGILQYDLYNNIMQILKDKHMSL